MIDDTVRERANLGGADSYDRAAEGHADGLRANMKNGVLTVTLDRPRALNAIDAGMLTALAATMESAATDPTVGVVVLRGAGRAFCSGADLGSPDDRGEVPTTVTIEAANRAVRSIRDMPRPVVAVVHGPAAGVGVSLALSCDLVLAAETAYFMLAFTKVGLMPDGGASALVAASVGRARAMRMALLAEKIHAPQALSWGLVSSVFPDDQLAREVDHVLDVLANGPVIALRETKEATNAATLTELETSFTREVNGQSKLVSAHDFREGAAAFRERRPAKFSDR